MHKDDTKHLTQYIEQNCRNITGLVVMKDDHKVYEQYFNGCNSESRVHVYSVTKSIISLLIGIAIDEGYIKSIDQEILTFFPDYQVKKHNQTIVNITLKDIMTMRAPYRYLIPPYIKYFTSDDYLKFSLDQLGGRKTIGKFRYTPLIGPDILSGVLMKATGQTVFDFAGKHVFEPLDIHVAGSILFKDKEEQMAFNKATDISGWACDDKGLNTAGWGLSLSTMDMAKIALLYMHEGVWNDQSIVSKAWIKDSTRTHSHWKKARLDYGYLWWIIDESEHCFAAMGDGGNVIYVNQAKGIAVAITSLIKPKAGDRIDFIREHVEPLFEHM